MLKYMYIYLRKNKQENLQKNILWVSNKNIKPHMKTVLI